MGLFNPTKAERTLDLLSACNRVAAQIGRTPAHCGRVLSEIVEWTACTHGVNTWACEVGGLRLRGGGSVPGWTTADARGHLLATSGTGHDARVRLIAALDLVHEAGLIAETRPPVAVRRMVINYPHHVWTDGTYPLELALTDQWRCVRAKPLTIDGTTTLYYGPALDEPSPRELGNGAVTAFIEDDEVMVLIVPPPDSDPAGDVGRKARVLDLVRRLRMGKADTPRLVRAALQSPRTRTVRVELARFEIVP